jgi:protocatechuate 3,4-dioxygenase beta subunit
MRMATSSGWRARRQGRRGSSRICAAGCSTCGARRSRARSSRSGNATPSGRYRHPRDRQDGRDAGFQGRGRVLAGADGSYAFRTIRPVAYPGRTPHIHVATAAPGAPPLVTQFYVAGEPLNDRDGLFNALRDPRQRDALLLRLERADRIEPGALLAERDIILG